MSRTAAHLRESRTVEAYVPHDQGQGFTPTDAGQKYDSTMVTRD
jgi:hypothetical protein